MDISIVIVNYNTRVKLVNCLESIYKYFKKISFEVIVVDNCSIERIDDLSGSYLNLRIVNNNVNLGMGGGNNVGIKLALGDFVLILNPDTEIISSDFDKMLNYLKSAKNIGLIGPALIYPDGEKQKSCYKFPRLMMPFYRRTFLGNFNQAYIRNYLYEDNDLEQPLDVDWIMGSCLLMPRSVLEKLGGFDERFFMYFEDTDMCRRIKNLGLRVVYYPLIKVVHHHGRASAKEHWSVSIFTNKMTRVHLMSWLKYFWKWKTF
ncbi:MAG: glycosyltransferase family 2 protein [bacterium]